jgi:hypothetical protein
MLQPVAVIGGLPFMPFVISLNGCSEPILLENSQIWKVENFVIKLKWQKPNPKWALLVHGAIRITMVQNWLSLGQNS